MILALYQDRLHADESSARPSGVDGEDSRALTWGAAGYLQNNPMVFLANYFPVCPGHVHTYCTHSIIYHAIYHARH